MTQSDETLMNQRNGTGGSPSRSFAALSAPFSASPLHDRADPWYNTVCKSMLWEGVAGMAEKSTNVMDYLRWRGDLTLSQDPFNEVDALLLCVLSYIDFTGVSELQVRDPAGAVPLRQAFELLGGGGEQLGLSGLDYRPVMEQMASARRFEGLRLFGYENRHDETAEMQFGALSFLLPDESVFMAFMGTDRSMVGWKEDFNMSFLAAVPSQERAAEYAAETAALCPGRQLRLGGHSKGGNLAVWAAVHLPEAVQDRLVAVYNNDGPGFSGDLLDTAEYRRVEERVLNLVPESSIIGVLMAHDEDYEIIDSSYYAVMQHEPLSWVVMGNRFVRQEKRTLVGKLSDDVLREWFASMTPQEKKAFVDAMFDVLTRGGAITSLKDLPGGLAGGASFLTRFASADEDQRSAITEALRLLAGEVRESLIKGAGDGLSAAKDGLRNLLKDWFKS